MTRFLAPGIGLVLVFVLALLVQRAPIDVEARSAGADIRFSRTHLNHYLPAGAKTIRDVHPDFTNLSGWISAVGAAVGAADLDRNGVHDEACLVDPRTDTVELLPVPGSDSKFSPTLLLPETEPPAPAAPMGCYPADLDGDGYVDILVYYWGRSPIVFYGEDGGRFTPEELIAPSQVWNSTSANVADFDGDGHLDVLLGNYYPDGARVLDPHSTDNWMAMQASMSAATNAGRNRLYLGTGARTWSDASTALPTSSAESWTLAFGAQDLTGDLLPEVYVANDFGPDQLLVNHSTPGNIDLRAVKSTRSMTSAKSSNLGHDSFKGMGVAFVQLDEGRHPSIAVSNITQPYGLHESNFLFAPTVPDPSGDLLAGDVPYRQISEEVGFSRSGWAWDLKAADFNNDGTDEILQATGFVAGQANRWPELQELAMANDTLVPDPASWLNVRAGDDLSGRNANVLWCQQPDQSFRDCASTAWLSDPTPTRAWAVTDFNQDGLPDVLQANQWATSIVHTNETDAPPALVLRPVRAAADGATTAAIGATIEVDTVDGRTHRRQLYPGNGHAGVSSPELFFAVDDQSATTVSVRWRAKSGETHEAEVPDFRPGMTDLILHETGEVEIR